MWNCSEYSLDQSTYFLIFNKLFASIVLNHLVKCYCCFDMPLLSTSIASNISILLTYFTSYISIQQITYQKRVQMKDGTAKSPQCV